MVDRRERHRDCLTFWGKTFPQQGATFGQLPPHKPALLHMLDVAAVANRFLTANSARTAREAAKLGVEPAAYVALASFCAGLHDLGKFSRTFQAQRPDLWPICLGELPAGLSPGRSHWRATAVLLASGRPAAAFARHFPAIGSNSDELVPLIAAIAGHHGRPPDHDELSDRACMGLRWRREFDEPCQKAACVALEALARLTDAQPAPAIDARRARRLSWPLSGLITLADWVGSDATFFGPDVSESPIETIWRNALSAAERALAAKGLLPLQLSKACLGTLTPDTAATPRPMQRFAEEMALAEGPSLIIIEDVTGSGKTEAAILLAARIMEAGGGEGLYFALPTMATANGMHRRLEAIAPRLFKADGRIPSLVLAHGRSWLARQLPPLAVSESLAESDEPPTSAVCDAWISDDRRRAFLADIGAGTIDQAFLAALPKRHLTLRQYALAGRILVIDEAHCFDEYMGKELEALLELQAMNGGSAIVLSATLSLTTRRRMEEAFLRGLAPSVRDQREAGSKSLKYPLLTRVCAGETCESTVPFDSRLRRSVSVERIADLEEAHRLAVAAAGRGAAVLVLRNAVDEAIASAGTLRAMLPQGDRVMLFHARFAMGDRMTIEDRVLELFGRKASAQARAGRILVATQVVEQSLDLDFDLVISDLAPVDLLMQRAGRLWRHMNMRPASTRAIDGPKMLVLSPDPARVETADWLEPLLGRGAFVYPADVMWRSAVALFRAGRIDTPGSFRELVETVYGAEKAEVPKALAAAAIKADGERARDRTLANQNIIDLARGYSGLHSDLARDQEIGTRLGEPTVTVRLARRVAGRLEPWCNPPGAPSAVAWALSEVSVRRKVWGGTLAPADAAPLFSDVRASWPEWEQRILLFEVDAAGRLISSSEQWSYDSRTGLRKM